MKLDDLSTEMGMIHEIKDRMHSTYLPEQDFSDSVMKRIEQLGRISPNPGTSPVFTMKRLAIAVCVIGLLSGFSYAVNEWLILKDKAGNPVMEVRGTDSEIPDWQSSILDEVEKKITPGESAVVYFGSKEEISNKATDQILWTTSPLEYRDPSAFLEAVQGPLANSRLSVQVPDGYEFEAGYVYRDAEPQSRNDDPLTFAKTADGKEYAYGLRKPGNGIQSVTLKYKSGKREISYNVSFLKDVENSKFYVTDPSKDLITVVDGTETYYFNNALNWVEKSQGGFMGYRISSPAATKEQLLDFAKAILAH